MAQSSSFFITEQYGDSAGDSAPETVSNFLTAKGAEMQLIGLSKGVGSSWAVLTTKEARCAVNEADGFGGRPFSFKWGQYKLTVYRH
jgi:hypothetical protein